MIQFNLKKTAIYRAVKIGDIPSFKFVKLFQKLVIVLSAFIFLMCVYGIIAENFPANYLSKLFGLLLISLTFIVIEWLKEAFFNHKIKKPKLKASLPDVISNIKEYNLAEFLSFENAKAVYRARRFAASKKFQEVNSSLLFYFLLKENTQKLNFIFNRILLNSKDVRKILEAHFKVYNRQSLSENGSSKTIDCSRDFQDTIVEALKVAEAKNHQRIELGDIITALAKHDLVFKKILIEKNIKFEDIENLTWWVENLEIREEESKKFWEYKNLIKGGTMAKEWAAGYAITLDRYSIDWTDEIRKKGFVGIIGHKEAIEHIERVLSRFEINNALIVGEPGIGRGAIVQALAQKSLFGQSSPEINYKRVIEVDMVSLFSGLGSTEEVESTLDRIFQEAVSAGNIILVINDLHNYIGAGAGLGIADISGILTPYLKLPQFQIIGITTFVGLHKNIEQNPSILSLFEKVEASEISEQETIMMLENLALFLEKRYKKFITYPALREIIRLSSRYLPSMPFPKKAIDLLDEVMVYVVRATKSQMVLPEHVSKVVSEKTQVPVGEIESEERQKLLNLENLIHQRIINQEEAVKEVSSAMRRARADITIRKGPIGGFLFLGPTGVGKTETSKALAEIYFGSEKRMIRLDMSEFQEINDIPRLIGSPGQEGLLTTQVLENPFSLVLLDEIEKAHPNILNLFLQVLDEGHLTDGIGRKVDFKNTIIIATSNAGAEIIWEDIRQDKKLDIVKDDLLGYLFEKAIFRPEFINRFDAVVIFRPLTKENLLDITELLLQKLKKNLKEKEIEFKITASLKQKIVDLGYDPKFGAREIRRVIQDKVENVLASALLEGKIKRGEGVQVEPENFKLIINK